MKLLDEIIEYNQQFIEEKNTKNLQQQSFHRKKLSFYRVWIQDLLNCFRVP